MTFKTLKTSPREKWKWKQKILFRGKKCFRIFAVWMEKAEKNRESIESVQIPLYSCSRVPSLFINKRRNRGRAERVSADDGKEKSLQFSGKFLVLLNMKNIFFTEFAKMWWHVGDKGIGLANEANFKLLSNHREEFGLQNLAPGKFTWKSAYENNFFVLFFTNFFRKWTKRN